VAWKRFQTRRPDLVLLDADLIEEDGLCLCSAIRTTDAMTPILVCSGLHDAVAEARALMQGADAVLRMRDTPDVLLAQIEALLRRRETSVPQARFRVGACIVDAINGVLLTSAGARVECSLREVELLRHFAAHPGETFGRDELLTRFWGRDYAGNENALTLAICRLRAKLAGTGASLRTVPRKGYCLGTQ